MVDPINDAKYKEYVTANVERYLSVVAMLCNPYTKTAFKKCWARI